MTNIQLIEAIIQIEKDTDGKITNIINSKCDYSSVLKYFENQGVSPLDVERMVNALQVSGEIEAWYQQNNNWTPYAIQATKTGMMLYKMKIIPGTMGFRAP